MQRKVLAVVGLLAAGASYAADQMSVERASALDTSRYTSIGRLYFNNAGAASFVRFWNSGADAVDFEAKIVGGESGTDYAPGKTYRINVPSKASLQRSLDEIRADIARQGGGDITPRGGDTFLTLYVKNERPVATGFQHVSYNSNTGFFENLSICTFDPAQNYSPYNWRLVNVHTSQLAGYPSKIEIRNPDAVARAVRGRVFDAVTGTSLGAFIVNPAANGSTVLDMSAVEQMIGFRPSASQTQVNIEFDTADTSAYSAIVGHTVTQSATGAVFNLTQACTINLPRNTPDQCTANPSGAGASAGCTVLTGMPATAPDVLTDTFTVGRMTTVPLSRLTANDTNASGATVWGVSPPRDATGISNGDVGLTTESISYTPVRAGTVTFTYSIAKNAYTPNALYSNDSTVTLTVTNPLNTVGTKPTAVNDTLTGRFKVGERSMINLSTLTANDTLPDLMGSSVYVFGGISPLVLTGTNTNNGAWTVDGGNTINFWPDRAGQVTFSYIVRGNAYAFLDSNIATVTLTVTP